MKTNKKIKIIKKSFEISKNDAKELIKKFHSEMKNGLRGKKSSLKMLPTYAKCPTGMERGEFLALDLGGTNFRIFKLKLKGKRRVSGILSEKFVLKKEHITTTEKELFGFIADSIKKFMVSQKFAENKQHKIGFTFSFPIKQTGIAEGVLLKWTKGFSASGAEGKDIVGLLNKALLERGLSNTKITALANDTVSTLVAKSYENANCDMGVILGTGTNACYVEKSKKGMIINIEWGNFNKLKLTGYDRELDKSSINPGEQLLEKMVSGMYLGDIVRIVVKNLANENTFTSSGFINVFNKNRNIQSRDISTIENDRSEKLINVEKFLRVLGIEDSTYSDRSILKEVCRIVSLRASRLAAALIVAVLTMMDSGLSKSHTVAIDGSVYEKHPGFSINIRNTIKDILGARSKKITLSLTKDASGKGAAILAARGNKNE
ncbi:MAG: hexokinase [Candidatus Omnitrophota bacterium]